MVVKNALYTRLQLVVLVLSMMGLPAQIRALGHMEEGDQLIQIKIAT